MKFHVMLSSSLSLSLSLTGVIAATQHHKHDQFDPASYAAADVIRRDIAVIGGGATGTYAAIKLGDLGKSVVLVEKAGRLGGHTETYTDPATGTTVDYGVTAYFNNSIVTDFFARFDVPIVNYSFVPTTTPIYADFAAGVIPANFTPLPLLPSYKAELDKYPYLDGGYFLPDPVPQDLLLTWPAYIAKHGLTAIGQPTLSRTPGSGNPLDILAIYFFTSLNEALFREQQLGLAVTTANHDGAELFVKALAELGPNALLNSVVIAASRPIGAGSGSRNGTGTGTGSDKEEVKLVVKTPTGTKLIIASQLVLGIPPVLSNLAPFGLDSREHGILSQPVGHPYYAGLVANTGLSSAHSYTNVGTATPYHVPVLPGAAIFSPTRLNGTFLYWYSSLAPMTQAQVQSAVSAELRGLQRATGGQSTEPTHLAWADHSPFHLTVEAEGIAAGFYRDMYALQGYRNTWYVGALFVISSGQLWNSTALLLPDIVAAASS